MTKKAVGIALIKDNSVLFQLRDDKTAIMPKHWCLPCGAIEKKETLRQAAIREFEEETGYKLKNPVFFTIDSYLENKNRVKAYFFYEVYDGKQAIKCSEGEKMEFKSVKNLKRDKFVPRHDEFAQKAIKAARK